MGAGVVFLVTVGYLFTALPAAGWDIDMFDDPARLLPWLNEHVRLYQVLWLLYFVSQAFLLPVPWVLQRESGLAAAAAGSAAVILAMIGLIVLFATSPVVADGFRAGQLDGAEGAAQTALVLHDSFADLGKDLRLFSELLLAVWLVVLGLALRQLTGRRGWWTLSAVGVWTFLVVAVKLFAPAMPLEDWLGFLLGSAYLASGVALLRQTRPAATP